MSVRKRTAKEPSYIVPALERGLLLLQAFSKDKPVQSLGVLAKELDLPRATTFRLANTLEHLGFLIRDDETGEYRVGAAALKLGWNYLSGLELPEIAYPFLTQLRYRTGASVHMAVRDGRDIVYVSRLPTNAALSSNIRVGSRLPAHGSSMGRAASGSRRRPAVRSLPGDVRNGAVFRRNPAHRDAAARSADQGRRE
jgi:DNA-binding IclR family transcriptional regulator